jgi:hypothetical protein
MNFFSNTICRNPNITVCIHPLLLSLTETKQASPNNPDISSISETDKRISTSPFYTSPSALLPLENHFSGKNGPPLLSNHTGYVLTSVANCRECMISALQGHAAQGNSAATFHAPEDNLVHRGSASLNMHKKLRKHHCVSLGSVKGNLPNTCRPNVAGITCRAKGKQAQRVGSLDADPSSTEEQPEKSSQESRDWEAEPCMLTRVPVQHLVDDICCSLNA